MMEIAEAVEMFNAPSKITNFLEVCSNWQISNNKNFSDTISTASLLKTTERITLEDVVSFDTCIALQPTQVSNEPCMLDIKTTNCQKIARIAVVSEGNVLEFFKQFGEYATTIFAEFIDEYEGSSVYFAETTIDPPSTDVSVKFTKVKGSGNPMWIYGVKLILTEPTEEDKPDMFNHDIIKTFLFNSNNAVFKNIDGTKKILEEFSNKNNAAHSIEQTCENDLRALTLNAVCSVQSSKKMEDENNKNITSTDDNTKANFTDIKIYIDNKFHDMEIKLIERMKEMENRIDQKLDVLLNKFETSVTK